MYKDGNFSPRILFSRTGSGFYFLRNFWDKLNQMIKVVYFSAVPEDLFVTAHRAMIDVIHWIWKVEEHFDLCFYITRIGICWMHGKNRISQILQIPGIPYFVFAFCFDPFRHDCSGPILVKTYLKNQSRKSLENHNFRTEWKQRPAVLSFRFHQGKPKRTTCLH